MPHFNLTASVDYFFNFFLMKGVLVTIGLTVAGRRWRAHSGDGHCADADVIQSCAQRFRPVLHLVFRGTPLLHPARGASTAACRSWESSPSVITCALVGLILNEAAYLAEIVRSGFMAVSAGQREAAWALSLSRWVTFRRITLPQAFRLMIPPLGNSINSLLKATSLASVISVEEIMRRSDMLMQEHFQILEALCGRHRLLPDPHLALACGSAPP